MKCNYEKCNFNSRIKGYCINHYLTEVKKTAYYKVDDLKLNPIEMLCVTLLNMEFLKDGLDMKEIEKSELRQFVEKLIKQSKPIAEEICKEME
jgi:hypothetical protein